MKEVLISVIMPVFNAEKYLERAIQSILNQSFENIELIIIDDNSKDKSQDIIMSIKQNDSRVKYFHNIEQGVSAARNLGIKKAKGEYITFIDADDFLKENALKDMYEYVQREKSDICMASYFQVESNREYICKLPFEDGKVLNNEEIKEILIPQMIGIKKSDSNKELIMGSVWRLLIRANLINTYNIKFNLKVPIAEDLLFCIEVFSKVQSLIIMEKPYYCYVRYGNSTLEKYRENFLEESLFFYNEYEKVLRKNNLLDDNIDRFIINKSSMYTTAISNCFRNDAPKDNKKIIKKINDVIIQYRNDDMLKCMDMANIPYSKRIALALIKNDMKKLLIFFFYKKEKIRLNKFKKEKLF